MPRNASGTFTLVTGNPVVAGTTIESTWANTTLSDIATELTNSLSRTGQGGMTAAFRLADGTLAAPGLAFLNETGTGLYRAGSGEMWSAVQGAQIQQYTINGVLIPTGKTFTAQGDSTFSGALSYTGTLTGGTGIVNLGSGQFYKDASGNVGIGTSSPVSRLSVKDTLAVTAASGTQYLLLGNQDSGGASGPVVMSAANRNLTFGLGNSWASASGGTVTASMTLDSSGNLGLGVTPSAWGSTYKVAQIGAGGGVWGRTNTPMQVGITSNVYNDAGAVERYIGSAEAAEYLQASGAHYWYTAPSGTAGDAISFTQAMTLDASGNLALTQTRSYNTSANIYLEIGGTDNGYVNSGATSSWRQYVAGDANGQALRFDGFVRGTGWTERARITSAGDFVVGDTASESYRIKAQGTFAFLAKMTGTATGSYSSFWHTATSGDNLFAYFYTDGGPNLRGSIDYNRAGGLVRYNTTSDYRAKDILGPVQDPGATIDALKVYEGVMKGATQSRPMLIAHEAQAHAPYAVSGVKDEVNEDGTPKFQQMDVSSLVPLLLAEIQSLRARVAALES